ncbi:MAG: alpha-ketoglutarate-dependent dioxygenase AlkB [Myxococcales bacterium]|nr:alpha-ketoglutarate-dependent dioxygenase AlkB [Myxococcales bacterium]
MIAIQGSLFGHDTIDFDPTFAKLRRTDLGAGAWLDHAPGFLSGHERLFAHLGRVTDWQREQRAMYDVIVPVPRLIGSASDELHPVLEELKVALSLRYGVELTHTSFALYRDGSDSVAWHGDRIARDLPQTIVVTLSLGAPRPFRLRPAAKRSKAQLASTQGPRRPITLNLGWGDLVVMGGTCQRTWEHCVPKRKHADPRLVVMFRPTWRPSTTGVISRQTAA